MLLVGCAVRVIKFLTKSIIISAIYAAKRISLWVCIVFGGGVLGARCEENACGE